MAKRGRKPGNPSKPPERKVKSAQPVRRQWQVLYAEHLLAQQLEDAEVEKRLVEHFGVTEPTAAKLREDAWRAIISVADSNRPERFKQVLHALRHLYSTAFSQGKLSVCVQVLHQMREMFDLINPYIESGSKDSDKLERTTEDLNHFVMTGEWPEETAKRKASELVTTGNPLDDLV